MIAPRSTKSGLPRYPAKIDARKNCWDTSTVIQLKCWGYAMLNFSGHTECVLITRRGGRTRLIPRHPLKRVRTNLYSAKAGFFFYYQACSRFRPDGRFFRCVDSEDNNEITLRSITRRYPRRLPIRAMYRFFPQHFQYFGREFVSDVRAPTKSYATKIPAVRVRCLLVHMAQIKIRIIRNTAVIALVCNIRSLSSANRVLRKGFYIVFLKTVPGESHIYLYKYRFIETHFRKDLHTW